MNLLFFKSLHRNDDLNNSERQSVLIKTVHSEVRSSNRQLIECHHDVIIHGCRLNEAEDHQQNI